MMPGLIVLIRALRFPQRTASALMRKEFPRFEIWYAWRESFTISACSIGS